MINLSFPEEALQIATTIGALEFSLYLLIRHYGPDIDESILLGVGECRMTLGCALGRLIGHGWIDRNLKPLR